MYQIRLNLDLWLKDKPWTKLLWEQFFCHLNFPFFVAELSFYWIYYIGCSNATESLFQQSGSTLTRFKAELGSFHKLCLHLGVGWWSEKRVVHYIRSVNYRDVPSQRMPKNANVICESSPTCQNVITFGLIKISILANQ